VSKTSSHCGLVFPDNDDPTLRSGARLWSKTQPQRVGNMKPLSSCRTALAFELLRLVLRTPYLFTVAQIFNLPYRRFVIGRTLLAAGRWQVKNLRYSSARQSRNQKILGNSDASDASTVLARRAEKALSRRSRGLRWLVPVCKLAGTTPENGSGNAPSIW